MNPSELIRIVVSVAVFGLVFSSWCICIVLWVTQYLARLKKVQKRLDIGGEEANESEVLRLWREVCEEEGRSKSHQKATFAERLERLRSEAGWTTPAHGVILGVAGVSCLAGVGTYMVGGGAMIALGMAFTVVVIFCWLTQRRIRKREELFERQLVDALSIASRALRAGHPLVGAFQLIAEEIAAPVGPIFFNICQEQALGLNLKDSIRKVAQDTRNPELKLFATAVAIQLTSGGNLADLMDSLAAVLRVRMRLNRRVRVITAQTQLSKKILIALPIILFFALNLIAPDYMNIFYITRPGKFMLGAAAVSVLFGAWMMGRLSVLHY